jgi:hypothetical protein
LFQPNALVEQDFSGTTGGIEAQTAFNRSLLETCNFHWQLRVVMPSQQRISVVGDGNFGVGKQSPPPKPGQPMVEPLAGNDSSSPRRTDTSNPQKTERPRICGAMTQQCGDSGRGNDQTPQKFVHLVGCRDPNARPATWVRPGSRL